MAADFSLIAPFYDFLVRFVFGKSLWNAQRHYLGQVMPGQTVLILGGGTGRILDWLPDDCQITFLEKSSRMIERAKCRREVSFIQADFLEYSTKQKFDWVICPFFLDCFDPKDLENAVAKCRTFLHSEGKLMVTDFYNQMTVWSKFKLWAMHVFFRTVSGLEARKLQDIQLVIENSGFTCLSNTLFPKHGVFSSVYISNS